MVAVTCMGLLTTRRLAHSTKMAQTTTTLSDLFQDARFYAATADDRYQAYVSRHGLAERQAKTQAMNHLQETLIVLAGSPGVDRNAVRALQDETSRYIRATAQVELLVARGQEAAANRLNTSLVDPSAAVLARDLSQLEEGAHLVGQSHLADATSQGRWLSLATPVVLGASLLVAVMLFNFMFNVLRRYRRGIETLATTDPLTGLPNRLALTQYAGEILDGAGVPGEGPVLLLLDLDRFKEVNDSLGHHYGDKLLMEVAHRLRGAVKREDMVVRLGGDEFAILLADGGEAVGISVADRVRTLLHQPFVIDQMTLDVGVSVGIAGATPEAPDLAALLRCADVAMYVAKESGDGSVVYTREHDARTGDKIRVMSELRRALDHDELLLHYQPKVALDDGRLLGVEALVRWQHPTRGLLAPGAFLPTVEDTELMDRLTTDVLNKALRQARAWQDQGRQIPVSVNIPTRSLLNLAFPTVIEELLDRFGIAAELLCLEITESSAMRDPKRCRTVLEALRMCGVRISIDDYGTGYASMAYLKDLPVDELKIDRSFVERMAHDAQSVILARSIVELGHNLGLTVVGEGVEDSVVGELLRETGCDIVQGYHYARPMPGDAIVSWQQDRPDQRLPTLPHQRNYGPFGAEHWTTN
jgi:diguanylate cyclase (GGDEF)-like protein